MHMYSAGPTHLCQGWGVQGACPDRTPVQGLRRPDPRPTRCRRRREQSPSMLAGGDLLHGVNAKHRAGCDAVKPAGSMGASTIPSPTPPPLYPAASNGGVTTRGDCVLSATPHHQAPQSRARPLALSVLARLHPRPWLRARRRPGGSRWRSGRTPGPGGGPAPPSCMGQPQHTSPSEEA